MSGLWLISFRRAEAEILQTWQERVSLYFQSLGDAGDVPLSPSDSLVKFNKPAGPEKKLRKCKN